MSVGDDPGLRASLLAARAWGVSPSRFYGKPAVSTTTYDYDAKGRLVAATTVHDPDWTDEDRDLAWELQAWEASLCPGCRAPLDETTKAENEDRYRTEEWLCHRCAAIGRAHARMANHQSPQAIVVSAQLRQPEAVTDDGGGPADR